MCRSCQSHGNGEGWVVGLSVCREQSDRSYKEFAQFHLKPDCYLKDLVKVDVPDELEWE